MKNQENTLYDTLLTRGKPHLAEFLASGKPSTQVPTAGVDRNGQLHLNAQWLSGLSIREVEAVLMHEALHLALNHIKRGTRFAAEDKNTSNKIDTRKWQVFNLAADAHINHHLPDLKGLGGVFFDTLPELKNKVDPSTLTTEKLAMALLEVADDQEMPESHDEHMRGTGDDSDSDDQNQSLGGPTDPEEFKKNYEKAKKVFDSLSEDSKGKLAKAFGAVELVADTTFTLKSSKAELEIQKLVGAAWFKPQQPSYGRPSRRLTPKDYLVRGKAREFVKPTLDIFIDVSGSMAHIAPQWVEFGRKLSKKYGGQMRVSLWSDDVPVPTLDVPENFQSGGTNWNGLEKRIFGVSNRNHKVVVITDGEGCSPGQINAADLVILTGAKQTCSHKNEVSHDVC